MNDSDFLHRRLPVVNKCVHRLGPSRGTEAEGRDRAHGVRSRGAKPSAL